MNDESSPESQPKDPNTAIRRRRFVLVTALVFALSVIGIVAVIVSRGEDPLDASKSPTPAPAATVSQIKLRPTSGGPDDARGLAEVVKGAGRYELRLIAQNLKPTRDDTSYRVYFSGPDGDKTLGRTTTDKRGTLLGSVRIDAADLTKYTTLRIALQTPTDRTDVLRGKLPR